jgi:iron complex transport system substrate-binding protein
MENDHRIVTLIASATEIVCALGFEDQLVGTSHECDFPPIAETLPICSESKIDHHASSKNIDDQVLSVVRDSLSVYRVHTHLLEELSPTVIVTQDHCEVCAVSLKDVEQAVCDLVSSQPQIVSLSPNDLADIWKDITLVAEALDAPERGETLIAELKSRLAAISQKTSTIEKKPTVACIEWIEPPMVAGNWVPEILDIAGGIDVLGKPGEHSGYIDFEKIIEADPDFIFVLPCGFDLERSWSEMPPMTGHPGWSNLTAVRNGRVFITDGNQYFNRPGPRVVESTEIFAEVLHPELFQFGHEGTGWRQFEPSGTITV